MTLAIQILNASGHLTLEWDPDDPAAVEAIRVEVQNLQHAGYTFYLTEEEPADAVAAGRGKLLVKRLTDPVAELAAVDKEPEAPKRRGRPAKPTSTAVATRPMAGG